MNLLCLVRDHAISKRILLTKLIRSDLANRQTHLHARYFLMYGIIEKSFGLHLNLLLIFVDNMNVLVFEHLVL